MYTCYYNKGFDFLMLFFIVYQAYMANYLKDTNMYKKSKYLM